MLSRFFKQIQTQIWSPPEIEMRFRGTVWGFEKKNSFKMKVAASSVNQFHSTTELNLIGLTTIVCLLAVVGAYADDAKTTRFAGPNGPEKSERKSNHPNEPNQTWSNRNRKIILNVYSIIKQLN